VLRVGAERILRALAITLLAAALVAAIRVARHGAAEASDTAHLRTALARWSTVATPVRTRVRLDHPPGVVERDWLSALPRAGTSVAWSGPNLLPTALNAEPIADPAKGIAVDVAAPAAATVMLRDTLGPLDSSRASATGVRFTVPGVRGALEATVGPVAARAALRDSLALHRLLVLGRAQWETKFTIAALEERGWQVDAHIVVSPKGRGDVRQGDIKELDTARYSAVLAIDTTAARYGARIAQFVRQGGGLLLWAPAAEAPALAALAPGAPGTLIPAGDRAPSDSAPREVLEVVPIIGLRPDAIVLERRGDVVTLAARRVGPGRVVETGYTDSWRWRMAGGDAAPAEQRTWLALLVAGVAYTGRFGVAAPPTDVAPLATLIDRLGPPTPGAGAGGIWDPMSVMRWAFGLAVAALLVEWSSRRLRGVK